MYKGICKKLLGVVLASVLVLAMGVPVFATEDVQLDEHGHRFIVHSVLHERTLTAEELADWPGSDEPLIMMVPGSYLPGDINRTLTSTQNHPYVL